MMEIDDSRNSEHKVQHNKQFTNNLKLNSKQFHNQYKTSYQISSFVPLLPCLRKPIPSNCASEIVPFVINSNPSFVSINRLKFPVRLDEFNEICFGSATDSPNPFSAEWFEQEQRFVSNQQTCLEFICYITNHNLPFWKFMDYLDELNSAYDTPLRNVTILDSNNPKWDYNFYFKNSNEKMIKLHNRYQSNSMPSSFEIEQYKNSNPEYEYVRSLIRFAPTV
jgi:hypothetical protein